MGMNFDQRIERIYTRYPAPHIANNMMRAEISAFPSDQRPLVGARATFIKQRLLYEGKARWQHTGTACGLCACYDDNCEICPAYVPCAKLEKLKPRERMDIAYGIYMEEHKKFVIMCGKGCT